MATPRPRPYTTHFPRKGTTSTASYPTTDHHPRAATSLSTPKRPLTRARSLPSSFSLPSITRTSQHRIDELSLGADARRSALRSLANNPSLARKNVDGRVSVASRECYRPFLSETLRFNSEEEFPGRVVMVSRDSYHSRSHSPTYQTLILAKAQIEVLMMKKLREIGDCVECQQETQQYSEKTPESNTTDHSPSSVGHTCANDDALSLTDSKRPASQCRGSPLPERPVRFGSGVLRANRRNKAIQELDEEEVAEKLRKWTDENSTNLPTLERLDIPEDGFTRPCQKVVDDEDMGKKRFMFLKRTSHRVAPAPVRSMPKLTKRKRRVKKTEVTPKKDGSQEGQTSEQTFTRIVAVSLPVVARTDSPKQEETTEENVWMGRKSSPPKSLREFDYDRIKALINRRNNQSEEPLSSSIDPNPGAEFPEEEQVPVVEDAEPLTAKEKFIRIQDRMADIKRAKRETMTSFADYSYLMANKKRTQTHLKQLGTSLSKRLEKMTVFQSKDGDLSDGDEDDDRNLLLDFSDSEDDSEEAV